MRDHGQIVERTKRHPLSKVQLAVLAKLATDGPCATSTSTTGVYVTGTAAAALERRGLVQLHARKWDSKVTPGAFEYEITDAGRKVLSRAGTVPTCAACPCLKTRHAGVNATGSCPCGCARYRVRR